MRLVAVSQGVFEYIRQRLFNSTKSESEQIFSDYINELKSQKAELIQLRKEFRLIVGALLQALDECNMSLSNCNENE